MRVFTHRPGKPLSGAIWQTQQVILAAVVVLCLDVLVPVVGRYHHPDRITGTIRAEVALRVSFNVGDCLGLGALSADSPVNPSDIQNAFMGAQAWLLVDAVDLFSHRDVGFVVCPCRNKRPVVHPQPLPRGRDSHKESCLASPRCNGERLLCLIN